MKATIQARLDAETQAVLARVLRDNGWTVSKAVRQGIHALGGRTEKTKPIKIIGLGKYDSGIPDLASNKKHLAELGLSSMPGGKPPRGSRGR